MQPVIGWEEAAATLLVAGFLGGATLRHQDALDRTDARTEVWLDVADRAEARWANEPETGSPLLDAYPERAEWDDCIDRLRTPGCEGVRRAAVFFPGPDAGLADFWFEGPGYRDAWAFEQPVTDRASARVRASAIAALLGSPALDRPPKAWAEQALAGQTALREAWAPDLEPTAFVPMTAPQRDVLVPRLAERAARSGSVEPGMPRLAELAARVRMGETPDVRDEPGAAGLVALELGRMGRVDALETVEAIAVHGPSATDRLAGLYARQRLQSDSR